MAAGKVAESVVEKVAGYVVERSVAIAEINVVDAEVVDVVEEVDDVVVEAEVDVDVAAVTGCSRSLVLLQLSIRSRWRVEILRLRCG